MSNAYFEGQVRNYLEQHADDFLIERLKTIKGVSDNIASTEAWNVVLKDAEAWKQQMDDRWQDVYDEKVLNNMRTIKQAYKFILDVPVRYKQEVEMIEQELTSRADYQKTVEEI